jgi:hypothetical protein
VIETQGAEITNCGSTGSVVWRPQPDADGRGHDGRHGADDARHGDMEAMATQMDAEALVALSVRPKTRIWASST